MITTLYMPVMLLVLYAAQCVPYIYALSVYGLWGNTFPCNTYVSCKTKTPKNGSVKPYVYVQSRRIHVCLLYATFVCGCVQYTSVLLGKGICMMQVRTLRNQYTIVCCIPRIIHADVYHLIKSVRCLLLYFVYSVLNVTCHFTPFLVCYGYTTYNVRKGVYITLSWVVCTYTYFRDTQMTYVKPRKRKKRKRIARIKFVNGKYAFK